MDPTMRMTPSPIARLSAGIVYLPLIVFLVAEGIQLASDGGDGFGPARSRTR